MNFIFFSNTHYFQINHKVAVCLNELYPESKFGVFVGGTEGPKKILDEQNELKYEFVIDHSEIERDFLDKDYNMEELKELEETIPEKSLWRYIAMDRKWGWAFSKGASRFFLNPDKNKIDVENILKVAYGYLRYYKSRFVEIKADVVVFFPGTHKMYQAIVEQVCKNLNIVHITLYWAGIKQLYMVTPCKEKTFPHVEVEYNKIINDSSIDVSPGKNLYDDVRASFLNNLDYSHRPINKLYSEMFKNKNRSYAKILLWQIIKEIISKMRSENVGINKSINNFLLAYQSKKLLNEKFYDKFDSDVKYLYYPLTGQPEYATQVMSNMWVNQLAIVEALAKSVPVDWQIYVKEHPATIGWRVRPFSFYKEIREYPNVRLIPIHIRNREAVKNSQMVVTIGSTAGWEAVLFYNKPVINFSRALYNITGLSVQCSDLTELSNLISDEYKRMKTISNDERKKRLVALIQAIINHSVDLDNPKNILNVHGIRKLSEKDVMSDASKIALAYKKYIDESKCEVLINNVVV